MPNGSESTKFNSKLGKVVCILTNCMQCMDILDPYGRSDAMLLVVFYFSFIDCSVCFYTFVAVIARVLDILASQ